MWKWRRFCGPKPAPPASSLSNLPWEATAAGDLSLNSVQEGCPHPSPPRTRPSSPRASDLARCNRRPTQTSEGARASAARPVSRSAQVDHLRAPGGALRRGTLTCPPACSVHGERERRKTFQPRGEFFFISLFINVLVSLPSASQKLQFIRMETVPVLSGGDLSQLQ